MPEELERKLKAQARKKFPGDKKRQNAYVYGALRKTGWTPSHQKKKRKKAVNKLMGKRKRKRKK
jgi:hypothetical protein